MYILDDSESVTCASVEIGIASTTLRKIKSNAVATSLFSHVLF